MYVVMICVGVLCTNFVDTKYETSTLIGCILKGKELEYATGHAWNVRTSCRLKSSPKQNKHGWSNY